MLNVKIYRKNNKQLKAIIILPNFNYYISMFSIFVIRFSKNQETQICETS